MDNQQDNSNVEVLLIVLATVLATTVFGFLTAVCNG